MRALVFAVLIAAAMAGRAEAAWRPAGVVARDVVPRVASPSAEGGLRLWSGDLRLTWAPGLLVPQRATLPPFPAGSGDTETTWGANARGDALLLSERTSSVRALALDAGGAGAAMNDSAARGRQISDVRIAVGADGTSAVAWTVKTLDPAELSDPTVWVRMRPPGGSFAPKVEIRTLMSDGGFDVAVSADGVVELVYDANDQLWHVELRSGSPEPSPAVRIAPTGAETLEFVTGAPGFGRVVYIANEGRVSTVLRTGPQTWSAPQLLSVVDLDPEALRDSLVATLDGGALFVYDDRSAILARRAAPGAAFGPPIRLARVRNGWFAYRTVAALGARGDAMVVWSEASHEQGDLYGCGTFCHDRVVAAVAAPDGNFARARQISPLGTQTGGTLAVAVSDSGERLVAWQESGAGVNPEGALVVVLGDARPDEDLRSDHRRPQLAVTLSLKQLRAASAGAPLRAALRCSEACGVRVTVHTTEGYSAESEPSALDDLPAVALERAGILRSRWRLTPDQRRRLASVLRAGSVVVEAHATDRAGNLRVAQHRLH